MTLAFRSLGLTLDGRNVLHDLDFCLPAGAWAFLVAPPGAGKTVLLRLAAGEIAPSAGRVERSGAAIFAHHAMPLDETMSSQAIVAQAMRGAGGKNHAGPSFGLRPLRAPEDENSGRTPDRADADERAAALLQTLGLETYLNHEPFRLSRGHRARLVIARALAARPAVLCLDDPFSPMDRRARLMTADALARAAGEDGLTILMASNDPRDVLRYADVIAILSQGPAATITKIIAHVPLPEAGDDELAANALHGLLWDALNA
ncbi:MAG: ATP-binding cassette domain-containing protein [Rhodoblastus sp.]